MLVVGMWYLERQRKLATENGEHFEPGPNDRITDPAEGDAPSWQLAIMPLALVLLTIIAPRVITMIVAPETMESSGWFFELLRFANSQPIVWPSISLMSGTVLAVLLFSTLRPQALTVIGQGTQDSIMPLINTAAVIGFGGVVTHTAGFESFTRLMLESDLPPLISMFTSVSLVSAITGSASGGLQIFMQTMAPAYIEMGIAPETLHRLATMASGGFDSLPHCGAIVAMLTITGLSHREAYRDVGMVTVVIPVGATLVTLAVASLI